MAALNFTFDPSSIPGLCNFADLPDIPAVQQLKSRRQWVCWRYVPRDEGKPTKPPFQPATGMPASHSNPRHWGSYDDAVRRAARSRMDGVGYVLTSDDDLTGFDLDNCRDPDTGEIEPWAQEIVDLAETYCEVSPSETGLRLIGLGKVAASLKRDPVNVEVYGTQRYLTITGWHVPGTPTEIRPAPQTLATLERRVAAFDASQESTGTVLPFAPVVAAQWPTEPTEGTPFFRNVNSAALANLQAWVPTIFGSAARFQPGTGAYRVSSRSLGRSLQEDLSIAPNGIRDWGVGDMGDARQGARTPIDLVMMFGREASARDAAFWLCQKMGKDPTSFGYVDREAVGAEIAANLVTRQLIETNGVLHDEHGEIVQPVELDDELPADLTRIPGLLGYITDWICDTARRPQRGLALGAALTVLGTACGRHLAGPTGSGTHLYVVGLAPTGAGKDHALQQILTALNAAKMSQFIGPSQFISMPAVINFMVRSPLAVCAMDEFGSFMKRINNRRASGFEGAITGILRTAWGASFKPMPTPEWAGKTSETILAPAMSIYGVSTAEEFYGALEGGDTSNGVLNRLLVIETRQRPHDTDPKMRPYDVPARVADGLLAVMDRGGLMRAALLGSHDMMPDPYQMGWGAGAEAIYKALVRDVERRCDGDVQAQAFFARTAEMAVRLATIRAAGVNPERPVVSQADMEWGAKLATWSAMGLARGATDYIADSENQSSANLVRRAIRDAGGRIKHRDLLRRLNHRIKARDLLEIIKSLTDAEQIAVEESTPPHGGPKTRWYSISA